MTDTDRAQDVVEVLQTQHDQVRDLLRRIDRAAGSERAQPFAELVRQLKAHEAAEESVVYPALRTLGNEASAVADRRVAEEKEAEKVIAELEKMDPASAEFTEGFAKFRGAVEKHASAEESEVFPLLTDKLGDDTRRELGSDVLRVEALRA
ncbi:MAG: hemerythrin domain-containing protein [Ilumatobacteraceae bacterium]